MPYSARVYMKQFLGLETEAASLENARVVILPFPYEGGISYGQGTVNAPDAILDASYHLELYDEVLDTEPFRAGIVTVAPPSVPGEPEAMTRAVYESTRSLIEQRKFVVLVGGDHSISSGYCKALLERYERISVIQLDAHADLRESYDNSPWSHACVMARIREMTRDTLQLGIRSLSLEEAKRVKQENIMLCTMHEYRSGAFDLQAALQQLPDPVFLTLDVDAFDWSVIASTGTPEPGGFLWDEGLDVLRRIFSQKHVVGFDVVELAYQKYDRNSPFAVAKLIYKMLAFQSSAGRL